MGRLTRFAPAVGLFLFLLVAFCIAGKRIGVTWDEVSYFRFSDTVKRWVNAGMPTDPQSLRQTWVYDTYLNPHPPFMKVVSAAGTLFFPKFLGFPLSYRFGHIVFCCLGLVLSFVLLRPALGTLPSLLGVLFVVLQPRLFAEFILATTDGPMAIGWLVLALLAWRICEVTTARERFLYWAIFYLFHGMITATKLTGFLAIVPVLGYFAWRHERKGVLLSLGSCLFALGFLVIFSPHQWGSPVTVCLDYLFYPWRRTSIMNVPTFYQGELYGERVPWHYFFVMSLFTVPTLHLLLALAAPLAFRKSATRSLAVALLPGLLTWCLLGLLPSVPKHDGVRQFAAFFPFTGLMAWLGGLVLYHQARERLRLVPALLRGLTFASPVLLSYFVLLKAHPFELSYYNYLAGGLKGAEGKGLEINYYLDAINPEVLAWLNRNLRSNDALAIFPLWPELFELYQERGALRQDIRILPGGQESAADYWVLARRRSVVRDEYYTRAPAAWQLEHQGVSLVKIVPRN